MRSWKARAAAVAVCAVGVLSTGEAGAIELGTPAKEHPFRSAQNFALELRFSPYYPQIDDEPGLTGTPFKDRFGDKSRLMFGIEFDWQVLRIPYVGTIGPGVGAHLVGMSRPATTISGEPSGDESSRDNYPFYLSAVLRADTFWHDAGFPLVPYGKLGIGWAPWRASNTGGTSRVDGISGKGQTFGTHVALGLAFPLDSLDSGASRNMDNSIGINNTYFYAEYYWLNLNGLGQDNALRVGTNTWAMGLAFEF